MSAPLSYMQPKRRQLSTQQLIALLVFMVTGPLLALDYWTNGGRSTYLGSLPLQTLCIVASIGGAISFPLYVSARGRLLAIIPGALAGFGAFGLHLLYTGWLEKDIMHSGESMVVAGVGASPGILLCWALMKFTAPKEEKDEP
jgi:hypothetical protein